MIRVASLLLMFKMCLQRRAHIQYDRFTKAGKERAPKRYLLDTEISNLQCNTGCFALQTKQVPQGLPQLQKPQLQKPDSHD